MSVLLPEIEAKFSVYVFLGRPQILQSPQLQNHPCIIQFTFHPEHSPLQEKQLCLQSTFAGSSPCWKGHPRCLGSRNHILILLPCQPAHCCPSLLLRFKELEERQTHQCHFQVRGNWGTGSSGFPSPRQRLLSILNLVAQALNSLLYPGFAGN